jgi:hypothetical protein
MVIGFIQFEKVRHLDAGGGPPFFALRWASILAGCSTHYPVSQLELWTDSRLDASLHEAPWVRCEQVCCLGAARRRNLLNQRAADNELMVNIRCRFTRGASIR